MYFLKALIQEKRKNSLILEVLRAEVISALQSTGIIYEMLPFQHPWRSQSRSLCPEEPLIPQAGSTRGARSREELRFGLLASGNFPPVALEPQDHGSSFCTNRAEGKERENLTLPIAAGIKLVWFWGIHWELQPLVPPGSCRTCW